jgi:hypothetical protein
VKSIMSASIEKFIKALYSSVAAVGMSIDIQTSNLNPKP